jgi:protein gp37
MSDLFHESLSDEQIEAVFGVMAATPQHQYVVLTKRLDRAVHWFEWMSDLAKASGIKDYEVRISLAQLDNLIDRRHHVVYPEWPLPNVIMCASVEDQKTADERVPILLQIPARWRGVSVEPMLSGINIGPWLLDEDGLDVDGGWPQNHDGLDLAICGAETGPGKRNFKDEWALDLRDQCKIAGVPYFFKKDGSGNGSLCGVEYHEWI